MDLQTTLIDPAQDVWARVFGFLPTLISVVLILFLGWIIACIVQKMVTRFLKLARLDTVSEKVGIANVLSKGDINYTLSEIIGVLIYWLLMLVVLLAAVNALQLNVAAVLLQQVVLYIPNVIASVFILVIGIFVANIVANTIRTAAATAGVRQSRSLGQFAQVIIVVFTIIEAMRQLKIDTSVIEMVIQAGLLALGLGIGLAIGLGCKDIAFRYVNDLVDSFKAKK